MYHFKYVTKAEARKVREKLENLVHEVQDEVRDNFTLQYYFIGSSARNMITYDPATNIGFDFVVNLEENDNEEQRKYGRLLSAHSRRCMENMDIPILKTQSEFLQLNCMIPKRKRLFIAATLRL